MLYSAGDLTANCRKPSSSSYTFDEFKALNSSSYVPTLSSNSSSSNTTCYTNMTRCVKDPAFPCRSLVVALRGLQVQAA